MEKGRELIRVTLNPTNNNSYDYVSVLASPRTDGFFDRCSDMYIAWIGRVEGTIIAKKLKIPYRFLFRRPECNTSPCYSLCNEK